MPCLACAVAASTGKPRVRASYKCSANVTAAASVISNCMATTAGRPRCTRLAATPANGAVSEERAPSHAVSTARRTPPRVEQGEPQGVVVVGDAREPLARHLAGVPVSVLEQQQPVFARLVVCDVADEVKEVEVTRPQIPKMRL